MEEDADLFRAFSKPASVTEGASAQAATTPPPGDDDLRAVFEKGSARVEPSAASTAIAPFVGFNRALINVAGAPVDLVNAALSRTFGYEAPEAPFGGSESIKRGLKSAGVDVDRFAPQSRTEEILQAGGKGVGEAAALALAAPAAAGRLVAANAPRTAEAVSTLFGMRAPVGTSRAAAAAPVAELAVPAFTGGVGAELAEGLASDQYKGLASLGGGLTGGAVGALGVGAAKGLAGAAEGVGSYFAPMRQGQIERLADERLGKLVGSKAATIDAIENQQRELVPGSRPTLFELTGDLPTGQAESRAQFLQGAPFEKRRGEQAAARSAALEELTPTAPAEGLSAFLKKRLEQFDETSDQAMGVAREAAQARAQALGGEGVPEQYGESLRASLESAKQAMRAERSALYKAVDPEGTVNIVVRPVRESASAVVEGISPYSTPLGGEAKRLFEQAQSLPDVLSFRDLTEFDKAVTAAMSAERRAAGETPTWGQLTRLKSAVSDAIAKGVENQSQWEQTAVAAGKMSPDDTIAARINRYAEGAGEKPVAPQGDQPAMFQTDLNDAPVYYPHGEVRVRYEVVDAPNLITSHDRDFRTRPDYPQELQPRDRASIPAQDQVNRIASDLRPERLGPSPEVNSGAPIVGPDNIVESGNGRTLAIQKAYEAGRGDEYRAWLESQGFRTDGMAQPVLVARRTTDLSPEDRVVFAQSANDSTGLRMGAVEKAASDARMLGEIKAPIMPGPLTSAENRDFVREFSAMLTPAERGSILDKSGNLSQEGEKRIRAALSAGAYEDPAFLARIFESTDNNIKALGDALTSVAGPWAQMRQAAARGEIAPEHDITPKLMDAVRLVMRARDEGKPLGFYLQQGDMFTTPVEQLARDIISPDGRKVASAKAIRESLTDYANEARKNVEGGRLFGEALKPEDILRSTSKRIAEDVAEDQAVAQSKPEPAPNMTENEAALLARAKAKHAEYAQTFKQGPVGDVLRTEGFAGQYGTLNATVVNKFFPAGNKGFEAATAFRNAVGDDATARATMQDYIAYSLKRAALKEDGTIDPQKFTAWRQSHDSALRAFPEFQGMFDDAVRASQLVDDLAIARREAVKEYQSGVVKKLMGLDAGEDVADTVGKLIAQPASLGQVRRLAAMTARDPDAQAALKRAVADYMTKTFVTTAEAGTSDANLIKPAAFQKFVRDNRSALRAIFSDREVNSMQAIADDLHRSARSTSGNALPGRSVAAQDLLPDLRKGRETHLGLFERAAVSADVGQMSGGVKGIVGGISAAIANNVLNNMRKAGLAKVEDAIVEALLNPDLAAAMLKRVPDKPNIGADVVLGQAFRRLPVIGFSGVSDDSEARLGRASGGRTMSGVEQAAEALVRAAEMTKKDLGRETEVLLNQDDNSIAKALEVANQAI